MRLLIAEDDKALGLFLSRGLEADGHRVRLAADGGEAVEAFRQELPDLTILDLNMPVKDGEQVLDEVRMLDADLPVLVLTGRLEVDTRVRCLDHGADDLMTKPFSLQELRARCRALLRRKRETRLLLRAGDLELDRLEHNAKRAGRTIVLTNKEFALLEHLLLNRGQCVTRVELLDTVWNLEPAQTTNIVDIYVNYLRRKLEDPPPGRVICTVRGRGYASGQYQSFTIGADGTVTASYSNGQLQSVGQLALANVTNLQGLSLQGDGDYVTTLASGTAVIGASGTTGLGTVQDGALEASNVNISSEFSDLIIAQRAFEANAKSVTTFDTVTQDTINMVH